MSDTAITALCVGLLAAMIAGEQWKVARAKLRLDLFEKRYELFEILWSYLSAHVQDHGQIPEKSATLQNHIPQFYFLYGSAIGDFANEALTQGIKMDTAKRVIEKNVGYSDALRQYQQQTSDLYMWFATNATDLRKRFGPFLSFESWDNSH